MVRNTLKAVCQVLPCGLVGCCCRFLWSFKNSGAKPPPKALGQSVKHNPIDFNTDVGREMSTYREAVNV